MLEIGGISLSTGSWIALAAGAVVGWLVLLLLIFLVWRTRRLRRAFKVFTWTYLLVSGGFGMWGLQRLALLAMRAGDMPVTLREATVQFGTSALFWPLLLYVSLALRKK